MILRQNGPLNPRSFESRQVLLTYIKQKLNGNGWSEDYEKKVMFQISNFTAVLSRLWKKCTRNINKFHELNKEWLKKDIVLPAAIPTVALSSMPCQVGRPQKLFEDCSDRSKRRKIQPLIKSYTSPEILFAAKSKLHKAGNRTTIGLLNETLASPKRGIKIKKAYMSSLSISTKQYDTDEALALLLDNGLTKQQYMNIRKSAKQRNVNLYPGYDNVLAEKKKCYPNGIHVTETFARIELQYLVDHTITRLFLISYLPPIDQTMNDFEILYKWGCDGSSGQSQYKQMFTNSINKKDTDLFMFSMVPLVLRCKKIDSGDTVILWKNPRPSSTRYCRPIKFEFKKETIQSTIDEVNAIEEEIKTLIPTTVISNNIEIQVLNKFMFTMVDGKVIYYNIVGI